MPRAYNEIMIITIIKEQQIVYTGLPHIECTKKSKYSILKNKLTLGDLGDNWKKLHNFNIKNVYLKK